MGKYGGREKAGHSSYGKTFVMPSTSAMYTTDQSGNMTSFAGPNTRTDALDNMCLVYILKTRIKLGIA